MKRVITTTDDGSVTLYVPAIDEHYHSVKGAYTEAMHIFLKMGMQHVREQKQLTRLHVFEVGFGTGFNALLTMEAAEREGLTVLYETVELYPLSWKEVEALHYSDNPLFQKIHEAAWDEVVPVTAHFSICKRKADIHAITIPAADVVYFDAFSPEKQPEMWEEALFRRFYEALPVGSVLTTYCAKGEVRRRLQRAGFVVERLPGPPGGKREILRATVGDKESR